MEEGSHQILLCATPLFPAWRDEHDTASEPVLPLPATLATEVPAGVWALRLNAEAAPELSPLRSGGREEPSPIEAFVVEPVVIGGGPELLLLTPSGSSARVNGEPLPCVGLLRDGDQALIDGLTSLTVAVVRRSARRFAEPQHTAVPCVICRGPIVEGREIYVCACGALMHRDSPEGEDGPYRPPSEGAMGERTDCASMLSACPVCNRAIERVAGCSPSATVVEDNPLAEGAR